MPFILRLAASSLVALVAVAPALAAQSAPAASPPPSDSIAREAVALIQDGDAAHRAAWIARSLSASARASDSASSDLLLARLHDAGAPYELVQSRTGGRHRLVKLRSARADRVVVLDLTADRADPSRLGPLDVLESHAAVKDSIVWPATRPRADAAAMDVVERNLARLERGGALTGTVYVARGDTVLLSRGYGFANREDSIPNAPHTRFHLASMGKMFTATAVMQLVDAGKLHLDDALARVLPAYPNADRGARITIRELLEHSAGMGDLWSTPKHKVPGLTGALAEAGEVAWAPLSFEPGTRWSYSNEGYVVLAAVVEHLSGERFHDYIARHVLAPAGMTETVLAAGPDDFVPFRAVGYRPAADDPLGVGTPRANWSFLGPGTSGAGGGYSTVGDIARFARALRTGKLFSDSLRKQMWTARWDIPGYAGQKYGFAQFVQPIGSRVAVGHGGGGTGSGIDNGFKQFTDGSYVVVVLANMEPPTGGALADAIIGFLGAPVDSTSAYMTQQQGAARAAAKPIAELTLVPQRTRWALDVKVGGQPFRFGLDIGGGLTLLSTRAASAGGCTPWGRVTGFQMTGHRLDAARCDSVAIDAGGLRITPPISLVLPPEAVESGDANLDGSIALDAFEGRAITLDLANGKLVVESTESQAERVRGMTPLRISMAREAAGHSITVHVAVPTAKGTAWMELDSGNGGTVLVSKPYAALVGLDSTAAGPQHAEFDLLPNVRVKTDRAFTPDMTIDGNLGMPFLRRWLVTLDLASGRAWIAPGIGPAASAPEPALPPKPNN